MYRGRLANKCTLLDTLKVSSKAHNQFEYWCKHPRKIDFNHKIIFAIALIIPELKLHMRQTKEDNCKGEVEKSRKKCLLYENFEF